MSEQFTERTHYGDHFSYRVSAPGESFQEFMKKSPFYSGGVGIEGTAVFLRNLKITGRADYGWSDFTYTKHMARISVVVEWVQRTLNDSAGNPRYRLHTSDTHYNTEPGASLNYGILNMTNPRRTPSNRETYILDKRPVYLVLNARGHVTHIERDGKSLDK